MATPTRRGTDTADITQGAARAHPKQTPATVRRRGLIAGAATLAAGMLATKGAQPVAAATFTLGISNPSFPGSGISGSGDIGSLYYFSLLDIDASTLTGSGSCTGLNVKGKGSLYGIYADGGGAGSVGVYGVGKFGVIGSGGGSGTGVVGSGGAIGVSGTASGTGVYGESTGNALSKAIYGKHTANGYAVYGEALAEFGYGVTGISTKAYGVLGMSTSGTGVSGSSASSYGVNGTSSSSAGVYGSSTTGYGVLATVGSGGVAAVYAFSSTPNTPAFYAVNYAAPNPPNSLAGFFIGQVYINGPLVIAGGPKSAAVPHPDGTHRLLYCVESPEAWFEDFGEGTITGGKAEVKLDPDFAAVVDTSKLHVFFTEHGNNHNLHLAARSATGFTVQADGEALAARGKKASDVSGTFTYRVVAKRKDVAAPRLAKFTVPKTPAPPPAPLPVPMPGDKPKA